MPTNFTVLINAGSRRSQGIADEVRGACKKLDLTIDKFIVANTDAEMNAALRDLVENTPPHLLIGGGDGTLAGIVERLHDKHVTIGIIPLGTTNNVARNLGIPLGTEALSLVKRNKAERLWLGWINGKPFMNVASIGVSAAVANSVSDTNKKMFGRLAYALTGIRWFFKHRPFKATIMSGKNKHVVKTHQIIIANGKYHGSLPVSPQLSMKRNQLALLALGVNPGRLAHLRGLIEFAAGRHHQSPNDLLLHGREFTVRTKPVKFVETDGEITIKTPLEIRLVQTECKFYLP